MLSSPWVHEGVVKHTDGKELVSFRFMVLNARVFSVQCGRQCILCFAWVLGDGC